MVARWEAKVARQLEKIVALQRGARTPSGASSQATPQGWATSGALVHELMNSVWLKSGVCLMPNGE